MKWSVARLDEICDLTKGVHSAAKEPPGPFPMIVTGEERKTSSSFQFDGEAVCIPLVSSTGHGNAAISRVHYESGQFAVASILAAASPKDCRISAEYLYYYFSATKDRTLVPLMRGTSNVSLTLRSLAQAEVAFPSREEQDRISSRLGKAKEMITRRSAAIVAAEAEMKQLLAKAFDRCVTDAPRHPMSKVAPLRRRQVEIAPDQQYAGLGTRSFGRGIFHKPELNGADLTWQKLFRVEAGDLVFSNIKAWEGAFAVAGPEDHGRFGSHRYLTCVPDKATVSAHFLWYYLQSTEGIEQVQAASPGSADRNRTLGQTRLARIMVPTPPLKTQQWFDALQGKARRIQQLREASVADINTLMPSLLDEVFGHCKAAA
ncbi:restriction endonuclease subunit S [Sulfitobacter sp.]|uniref:restriction endonuclease subunit S n=1 Tax=Sulfitobacter sp. TaxID=1903071 RepID=UPI002635CF10|nr:restriction endonuclease subunit S [Sulfitobacter sp.]